MYSSVHFDECVSHVTTVSIEQVIVRTDVDRLLGEVVTFEDSLLIVCTKKQQHGPM